MFAHVVGQNPCLSAFIRVPNSFACSVIIDNLALLVCWQSHSILLFVISPSTRRR
jgi:hypothetical protein